MADVRHRFTTKEWHLMGDAGLFGEDARVELLDGEVFDLSPIGSRHAGIVNYLTRLFVTQAGDAAVVAVQNPVGLDEWSEPQPDLAVLAPRSDFYRSAHATPSETLLLIEVADSSLRHDRDRKGPYYAASGIRETWIVDLDTREVIVMRSPSPAGYQDVTAVSKGVLDVEALPGVTVDVGELFA